MKNISQEEPHDNGNGPTERDFGSVPSDIDAPADDTMVSRKVSRLEAGCF